MRIGVTERRQLERETLAHARSDHRRGIGKMSAEARSPLGGSHDRSYAFCYRIDSASYCVWQFIAVHPDALARAEEEWLEASAAFEAVTA